MTQFGKLDHGILIFAPNKIVKDNYTIYNPTMETLIELGYKIIEKGEMPTYQEGYHVITHYTETDSSIIESYTLEEDEEAGITEETEDLLLEMLADHEERICLIELGGLE